MNASKLSAEYRQRITLMRRAVCGGEVPDGSLDWELIEAVVKSKITRKDFIADTEGWRYLL